MVQYEQASKQCKTIHSLTRQLYLYKQKQNNFKNKIQSFPIIVAL
jgi:hypothetical protein